MHTLAEGMIIGRWKSYKTFKRSGDIQLHAYNRHKEFDFAEDRRLTIKNYKEDIIEKEAQTDQWKIIFQNKKYYLQVSSLHLLFEIITINHTVMVLQDTTSEDKVFLARQQHWDAYLKSNQQVIL